MDKSPDAFRTISEVASWLETPPHVLRFWETRFTQLKPVKRAGGRRYYRPADVALLAGIRKLLHDDGMTIRGVQKILREQGVRHVAALGGAILAGLPPPAGEESAFEDGPLAEHLEAEEAQEAPADLPGAAPPAAPPPAAPEPAAAEPLPEEVAPVAADRWWAETPGMALRALRRRGGPVDRTGLAAIARRAAALRARLAVARSTPGRT
ncbi:MAG: MerR family transcriptional regulator [Rhodobacteraceae bacterium]|jgi:DNA-binding transcriptional MerR regulator|nr:MerR family transcriptional regulator [Paracoccaceae bacterium]